MVKFALFLLTSMHNISPSKLHLNIYWFRKELGGNFYAKWRKWHYMPGIMFFWYLLRQVVYFIDVSCDLHEYWNALQVWYPSYFFLSILRKALFLLLLLFFISQYVYSAFIRVYTIHRLSFILRSGTSSFFFLVYNIIHLYFHCYWMGFRFSLHFFLNTKIPVLIYPKINISSGYWNYFEPTQSK